jgi:protein-S-isoprenylcysteine O-methyltransferase Ste14
MTKGLWPAVGILVVSLVAAAISAASGLKFWWAFAIVAVAVLINGFVATLEDDLPGGFNNPDGSDTPKYALATGWVLRIIGGILLLLCVVALALFFWG